MYVNRHVGGRQHTDTSDVLGVYRFHTRGTVVEQATMERGGGKGELFGVVDSIQL
jgi:hypothetical protein